MSKKNYRYDLRGLKMATVAFAILALAGFAVQIIRIIEKSVVVEFGYLAFLLIGWMLMLVALRPLVKYGRDFRAALIIAFPAIAAVVTCALLLVSYISSEMGRNAVLTIGVQFALYVCFLAQIMAYWYVLRGASLLCSGLNRPKLEKSCKSIRLPFIIIMILCEIAVQGAPVFSELIKYIVTGAAAAITLILQMVMISKLLSVYDLVDGKLIGKRIGDVLTDSKVAKEPGPKSKDKTKKKAVAGTSGDAEVVASADAGVAADDSKGAAEVKSGDAGTVAKEKASAQVDAKSHGEETATSGTVVTTNVTAGATSTESTDSKGTTEGATGKTGSDANEKDSKEQKVPEQVPVATQVQGGDKANEETVEAAEGTAGTAGEQEPEPDNTVGLETTEPLVQHSEAAQENVEQKPTDDAVQNDVTAGEEVIEEDWLRKEFADIALVGEKEEHFAEFKEQAENGFHKINIQTESKE